MSEIKHILFENGAEEIFRLIVTGGAYAGTYEIVKPDGWDEVNSVVDIDEELFNVQNFIVGETTKLKFLEYNDDVAYPIIKNVYREQGGDGQIMFRWITKKDGAEYEPLGENFQLNLNIYSDAFEGSMMAIETELKLRESQSKLLNREDVTVDLFSDKDIDNNAITPVPTFPIGFKKGDSTLENFYFASFDQERGNLTDETNKFYLFKRSDEYEFGDNANPYSGVYSYDDGDSQRYFGCFFHTDISLKRVIFSFSNFNIGIYTDNVNPVTDVWINIIITEPNGLKTTYQVPLTQSVASTWTYDGATYNGGLIQFDNVEFEIPSINAGAYADIWFLSAADFKTILIDDNASISITPSVSYPIIKTQGVRLFEAINQVCKNYTSGALELESNVLSPDGFYYNSSISTGAFLRGLPPEYTVSQKLKTSLKSLVYDGSAPLLALGMDIINDKVIVEDIDYFFKDILIADLSDKSYNEEDYRLENDKDISFNTLLFGSKKYSTNKKNDLKNFNTTLEATTPLITVKNKFDKQTDLIIDEYKIQELVDDKSSSTNDNDDDLVLIDMVEASDLWDEGVFENTTHYIEGGYLWLSCITTPFDTTFIEVGQSVQITEGLNTGTWTVLIIDGIQMKLSRTTGIQTGFNDTPIKYQISNVIKNRTDEGFTLVNEVENRKSSTNLRHNPKYHLARWFRFFGSGLRRKQGSEIINVTNYKNNSEAEMEVVDASMANELQGLVVTGANEPISRLRGYQQTYFNGQKIQITLTEITFEEFLDIFNKWRYGAGNDRDLSRGYVTVPTPDGIFEVFPFAKGFEHNKKYNELTIRGKVRGASVADPVLLTVLQNTATNVTLTWDYADEYFNPTINIQASKDGVSWVTLETVTNVKTATFSNDYFADVMTGTTIYFRAIVGTSDFYNKITNTLSAEWMFNNWVLRELSRTGNIDCGNGYLTLLIEGTADLDLNWSFVSEPGGGSAMVTDDATGDEIVSFLAPDGVDYTDSALTTLSLIDDYISFTIHVKNSTKSEDLISLNCSFGSNLVNVLASIGLEIVDSVNSITKNSDIEVFSIKRYFTGGDLIP